MPWLGCRSAVNCTQIAGGSGMTGSVAREKVGCRCPPRQHRREQSSTIRPNWAGREGGEDVPVAKTCCPATSRGWFSSHLEQAGEHCLASRRIGCGSGKVSGSLFGWKSELHVDVHHICCLELRRAGVRKLSKRKLRLPWKTHLSGMRVGLEVGRWRRCLPPWYRGCDWGFRMSWEVRQERQELSWWLRCRVNQEKVPELSAKAKPRSWRVDARPGLSSTWMGAKFLKEKLVEKPVCCEGLRFGGSMAVAGRKRSTGAVVRLAGS